MASSFEKSVKGATKIKAAPPKTKYIEHILVATHAGEVGVAEVFRALQHRLHDPTWTVVFKSLITVHLMIREGSPDATLAYLAKHKNMLTLSIVSDAQTQGRNIRHYAEYLSERARAYRDTKCDWVRGRESRLEKLTVDKGLLRETESVQHQLTALLKCDVMDNEPENEITITVFRLLVLDLLSLFHVLNQAMINILGHFFEMSKPDAERAMNIYRNFTRQTDYVVQYLSIARQYEHHTRVVVPKLKHAPINLGRQLEDYLKDPDFEIHRRQYLAEVEAKKSKGNSGGSSSRFLKNDAAPKFGASKSASSANASQSAPDKPPPAKGPDPDLIDFFDSIEKNQTPMAVQPQAQTQTGVTPWVNGSFPMPTGQVQMQPGQVEANGFATQPTGFPTNSPFPQQSTFAQQQDAFAQQQGAYAQPQQGAFPQQPQGAFPQQPQQTQQVQPNFTGTGFGGFSPQPFQPGSLAPIPQDTVPSFQTGLSPPGFQNIQQPGQQATNPFRQSMLTTGQASSPFSPAPQQQLSPTGPSTNPFGRTPLQAAQPSTSPFQSQPPQQQTGIQAMPTGTNPFAKSFGGPQAQQQQQQPFAGGGLAPQPTGSTNPFRQGAFVDHATGQGWQHNQQPIGGGLDQLETIPVFPRPSQQTPWQQ